MATALVPVFTGTLADRTVQLCDARALHTFMQVRRDFSNWIKGRIRKFGFTVGEDYLLAKSGEQVLAKSGENLGGRPSVEYHLTLDMAKELAMVENNEQGRAARRYFIECERQVQAAINATPYSVQRGQTLSTEQAEALRNLLTSHVQKLPKPQQGKAMVQGWSKLKAHFGTDYRHIPAGEFHEAVSIIARHIVDWELVDETPALPHQPTVQEIVADWVKKIEEPNGYPAFLFLPLVEAVQRKTARTTGMLPEAQAREITVRLERLCRLFHPFSDQAGDVIGVLRALRGLHPNSSAHTPGYLQLLPRL